MPTPTHLPIRSACPLALLLLSCLGGLVAAGCETDIRERDIQPVGIVEARRIADNPAVIVMDARPSSAFAAGHIPGAINVRIDAVDPTKPKNPAWSQAPAIIVYGDNAGSAAAKALVRRLLEAGYHQARLMEGGFDEWREMGLEIVDS